ncbi:MAG: ABC transporter ATP-binding protein [Chitinophagaceae bacterium]|nr:ABC transporter ATP-binding protein [Chitinophagaceae bacterium]
MQANIIDEITSYINHNDYSLAVRRTLDMSLDLYDKGLIRMAINWSKEYREIESLYKNEALPGDFLNKANIILEKAAVLQKSISYKKVPLLSAEKIGKTYGNGNFSLKPISLDINTGDVLGVVGENGNGKTTLLRCLAGQLSLDEGELDYKLLENPDYYSIKNHIAFIPQRISKWYGLLKDNLHFSATIAGVKGEQNELMVDFMLERLNLTNYAHLTWNQISSGYRTRFEIARILLQKPRLLILDEPLANLDINAQQTILTDLIHIGKGLHNPMGIILSSQQLHEVEKVADTVLFIKQGSCLYSSSDKDQRIASSAVEIETTISREAIINIFEKEKIALQFNGGFYTIISTYYSAQQIIELMINAKLPVTYFRDITHSTKRFFN